MESIIGFLSLFGPIGTVLLLIVRALFISFSYFVHPRRIENGFKKSIKVMFWLHVLFWRYFHLM
jgi:hypothetical protein